MLERVQGRVLLLELVQEQQQEPVQERVWGQEPGRARGPKHHHNLWLRWRGSKKSFSSTRQMSFSKHHRQRCANC